MNLSNDSDSEGVVWSPESEGSNFNKLFRRILRDFKKNFLLFMSKISPVVVRNFNTQFTAIELELMSEFTSRNLNNGEEYFHFLKSKVRKIF
jgi:hypothetical protein